MSELPDDLISPREAGELMGVTARTVRGWVRQGRLRGWAAGGRYRISRAELAEVTRVAAPAGPATRAETRRAHARALEGLRAMGLAV